MKCRSLLFLVFSPVVWCADTPKLRLDDNVRPVKYSVDLKLLTDSPEFTGTVDIDVDVRKPTSTLWLNAKDLTIRSASVTGKWRQAAAPPRIEQRSGDLLSIRTNGFVPAGHAKVHIEYSGKISPKNSEGIFQGRDGNNLYLFTQFESIDARRAFPCFDQPEFKTPWQVTLHVKAQARKRFRTRRRFQKLPSRME